MRKPLKNKLWGGDVSFGDLSGDLRPMRRIAQVFGNGESPEPSPIWHSHDPNTGLQIQQEGADYYDILERTQKATMDITPWMDWFLGCLGRAIEGAQALLGGLWGLSAE